MKNAKVFKSLMCMLLAFLCLCGTIPSTMAAKVGDYIYIETGPQTDTGYTYTYDGHTDSFLHMTIRDETQVVYCAEPNASWTNTYYQVMTTASDNYFNSFNKTQKEGIILALVYGFPSNSAKNLGVSNDDDAYAATQAIVWEYAAGVRTSPTKRTNDAWYNAIKGTKAETAYKNILTKSSEYMNSYGYSRDELIANNEVFMLASANGDPEQAVIYYTGEPIEKFGVIQVHKIDENGNNLSGAEFIVYDASNKEADVIGPTDSKGYAKSKELPYGKYTVVETVFPVGYEASDKTSWTITVDEEHLVNGVVAFEATNKVVDIELQLTKRVAPGYDGSGYTLAGAEYVLFKDLDNDGDLSDADKIIDTLVTDETGKATSKSLPAKTYKSVKFPAGTGYRVKETKAPEGFLLDPTPYNLDYITDPKVVANAKDTDDNGASEVKKTVNEYPIGVQVRVRKRMEDPYSLSAKDIVAEEGAEFQLYNSSKFSSYEDAKKNGTVKDWDYCVTNERGLGVWINGEEVSRVLNTGTYKVEQIKVGKNGLTMSPEKEFTITETMVNGANPLYTVTLRNDWERFPVEVYKKDALTGELITVDEAVFTIIDKATGEPVVLYDKEQKPYSLEKFSTVNGKFSFGAEDDDCTVGLPYGSYKLVEIESPDGYILSEEPVPFTIDEKTTGTVTVTKENYPMPIVTIQKKDARTGKLVTASEATFKVKNTDTGKFVTFDKTSEFKTVNGKVTLPDGLDFGNYEVVEIIAPDGYMLNSKPVKFTLDENTGKEITVTVENDPFIEVTIEKKDAKTGKIITASEATFKVKNLDNNEYVTFDKTSEFKTVNGVVNLPGGLPYGNYQVEEIISPDGYTLIDKPVKFTLDKNSKEKITITVENEPLTPVTIQKKDAETNKLITASSATFKVKNLDTGKYVTFDKTSEFKTVGGEVTLPEGLPYGEYQVEEILAPDGYLLNDKPIKFTIDKNSKDTITITVKNNPFKGTITVNKTGDQFVNVITSDTDFGKMYVPEYKEDGLQGVVFNVCAAENIVGGDGNVKYKKGEVVDVLTTDKNGTDTTIELPLGKYIVTEIQTLAGYGIDKKSQPVEIKSDGKTVSADFDVDFTNNRADVKLDAVKKATIWKTTEKDGLVTSELVTVAGEGFTFGLYADEKFTANNGTIIEKDALVATAISDKDGKITFNASLPFGNYYVKELAAPEEHYVIPSTKYPIVVDTQETTGETIVIKFSESDILNDFVVEEAAVIKIDAETGKPMKGVKIEIKDTNGKVWYRGYTDENGKLDVILEPGSYTAQEIETLDGYLLNDDIYAFTVEKNQKEPAKVEIKNSPLKGTITIEKIGPQFVGVEKENHSISANASTKTESVLAVAYDDVVYIPVFEDTYLANVKFNIVADEDIYSPDGVLQHKKGDVADTLTTSLEGPVTSKELWPGKYLVIETETNDGYQLDETPKSVEVTNDGTKRVTSFTTEFYNNRAPYEVDVLKEMVVWETITDGDTISQETKVIPAENFVFGLYTDEDITLYDGSEGLKADTLVGLGVTDMYGHITFKGSLPFGNYYVKELAVPKYTINENNEIKELSNYNMSEKHYPVTLSTDKTDGQVIKVNASDNAILNDFDRFPVVITKTDLVTSEPVVGAKVNIYNKYGETVYSQWTDENGQLADIILEPGTYTFEEIVAPKGYIRNTTIFEFTILEDGTVEGKVDFTNEPTQVTITKTDAVAGKPVAGAEITIFEASPDEATADEVGVEVFKGVTDENGQINVSYLEIGKWYIYKETKAANGFAVNKDTFTFIINEDGTITGDTTLVDDYTRFRVYKVNENGEKMAGVVFTMYDEQGNPVTTATTDEAGIAEFVGFLEGSYTIKETKTLDGYDLAPDSIKITNDGKWDNDAEYAFVKVINYKTVIPPVIPPKTGDNNNLWLYGVGMGVSLIALIGLCISFFMRKRKMINA